MTMKRKLLTLALVALTVGLTGSCKKNNSSENPPIPTKELSGEFSVSTTKKVRFSSGNLWYGTIEGQSEPALHFESAQWETTPTASGSASKKHVSHFTWSDNISVAINTYHTGDYLFCDEAHKMSIDGSEDLYYALSNKEWKYLVDHHANKRVTVNGKKGCVIAPDKFSGIIKDSYADDSELAADKLVFLPAAGIREKDEVIYANNIGEYWSSTLVTTVKEGDTSYKISCDKNEISTEAHGLRYIACSIRLVTDCK